MSLFRARRLALTLPCLLLLVHSFFAAPTPLRGVAVDETLEGEAVLARP